MSVTNRPVLVSLDETPASEQALPWSSYLAQRLGCGLVLVHAAESSGTRDVENLDRSRRRLEVLANGLRTLGVTVDPIVEVGEPVDVILGLAHAREARLISLVRHRRGAVARWLPGSTSSRVVQQASVPVLVQTSADRPSQETIRLVGPIVVPLDGSDLAELALPEAVTIARALGRPLRLVRADEVYAVLPDFPYSDVGTMAPSADEAERYLRVMALWLRDQGIWATIATGWDNPADLIREAIARSQAPMVVMATHGRSGIRRLVLGSVADAVISDAKIPVMLIGPRALEGSRGQLARVGSSA